MNPQNRIEELVKRRAFRLSDLRSKEYREKSRSEDKEQLAIEQINSNRIPELSGKS